jgi:hypothetical protein
MKNQLCRVYRNLHKKAWSIQIKKEKGWRVGTHASEIILKETTFKVYEAGREKVLKTKRKNVHAYIIGTLINFRRKGTLKKAGDLKDKISYNPYKANHFVSRGKKIQSTPKAALTSQGKVYKYH